MNSNIDPVQTALEQLRETITAEVEAKYKADALRYQWMCDAQVDLVKDPDTVKILMTFFSLKWVMDELIDKAMADYAVLEAEIEIIELDAKGGAM